MFFRLNFEILTLKGYLKHHHKNHVSRTLHIDIFHAIRLRYIYETNFFLHGHVSILWKNWREVRPTILKFYIIQSEISIKTKIQITNQCNCWKNVVKERILTQKLLYLIQLFENIHLHFFYYFSFDSSSFGWV